MAVDAGTIKSEIRIDIKKLEQDIGKVKSKFSSLAGDVKKPTDRIAKAFTGATDRIKGAFTRLSGSVKKSSDKIKNTFNNLSNSVKISAGIAFAAVGALAKASIGQFAEFEQSMANVQSVARGTPAEFKKLEDAALKAGETTRYSASQAAEALYSLASAGLNATDATNALEGALELAAATGSDLATASAAIATTLSQYGLEATEAGSITNVFAAAIANSLATLPKLQASLAKVGPLAGKLGVSLEETTGALQALYNGGIRGEEAGTALKNILSSLANEADPAAQKLAALGVSFADVDPAANSLADVIGRLEEANLSAGQAFEIFGKEAGTPLLTILAGGKKGFEELTAAVTDTDAAAQAVAIQNDTLKGSLDKLKSAWESFKIILGKALNGVFRPLVDLLKTMVTGLGAIPGPILATGVAAAGAATGFIAFSGALGVVRTAIAGLIASLGPVGLTIAGIGAAAGAIGVLVDNGKKAIAQDLEGKFSGLEFAADLSGEAIRKMGKSIEKAVHQGKSVEEIVKIAKEAGREYELTADQVLQLAERNKHLWDAVKDEATAAIAYNKLKLEQSAELVKGAENEIAARYKAVQGFEEGMDREEAAIESREAVAQKAADAELARVESVVAVREAAEARTVASLDVLDNKLKDGIITKQEYEDATVQAYEAEVDALYNVGYALNQTNSATGELTVGAVRLAEIQGVLKDALSDTTTTLEGAEGAAEGLTNVFDEFGDVGLGGAFSDVADGAEEAEDGVKGFSKETKRAFSIAARVLGGIADVAGAIGDLLLNASKKRIDAIEEEREAIQAGLDEDLERETERLDLAEEAALERAGVREQTQLERLESERQAALVAGDLEVADEKAKEIKRLKIKDEFDKKRTAKDTELKKKAAAEDKRLAKEKAQEQYKVALAQWEVQVLTGAVNAAQSVLATLSSVPYPFSIPLAIAAGAAGIIQTGIIADNKPQPPSFQTGGIVLPSDGGRTVRVAENGHSETLFNSGPEGQAFIRQMAGYLAEEVIKRQSTGRRQTPIEIRVPVIINEETVAEVIAPIVVDAVNNGLLELEK